MKRLGTLSRLALLALAALALTASSAQKPPTYALANGGPKPQTPPPQAMDPRAPLGLWNTNFGAVKIEPDGGGLHGAWSYDRDNQQVVGYFGGTLEGNLLRLTWREPAQPVPGVPQLAGAGWLAFDPSGTSFAGKWWSDDGQRKGDWTGTLVAHPQPPSGDVTSPYGGSTYGAPTYPPPAYPAPAPYNPPPSATYPPR